MSFTLFHSPFLLPFPLPTSTNPPSLSSSHRCLWLRGKLVRSRDSRLTWRRSSVCFPSFGSVIHQLPVLYSGVTDTSPLCRRETPSRWNPMPVSSTFRLAPGSTWRNVSKALLFLAGSFSYFIDARLLF